MKGKYITPEGEIILVHNYDVDNKLVSVHVGNGQHLFFLEKEFSQWQPVDQDTKTEEIADEPEEVITEKVKKKQTKKK